MAQVSDLLKAVAEKSDGKLELYEGTGKVEIIFNVTTDDDDKKVAQATGSINYVDSDGELAYTSFDYEAPEKEDEEEATPEGDADSEPDDD